MYIYTHSEHRIHAAPTRVHACVFVRARARAVHAHYRWDLCTLPRTRSPREYPCEYPCEYPVSTLGCVRTIGGTCVRFLAREVLAAFAAADVARGEDLRRVGDLAACGVLRGPHGVLKGTHGHST